MSSPLNVRIADGLLHIDDEPRLLLCASLFYFRIPREAWRERLRAVRESGYTCVDVYFPWNHHELSPGVWDFAGERDVAAFLELAREEGLLVLARPGPYICSEWDGGALPAWLTLTEGLRLRENEPRYLAAVREWFDRILPILRASEAVVLVQLENELDFFDCADPAGYLAALRDMALEHGITVPLVACAGQGDLERATGEAPGVVPAANFYPDDASPAIESVAEVYQRHLAARGLPLMVTETNRAHVTLRRLLSAGAKLIGPYLQVSGDNLGFTNAVNNWGDPLALLTSDYDFGGYLSPAGVKRPEYGEARLLAGMVNALGPALAAAQPVAVPDLKVTADFPLPDGGPRMLALRGGGFLLALANPGEHDGVARVGDAAELRVRARGCPFVLLDLPVPGGTLELSTAELCLATGGTLVFACDGPAQLVLDLPGEIEGAIAERDGSRVRIRHSGEEAGEVTVGDLRLLLLPRAEAAALRGLDAGGRPLFDPAPSERSDRTAAAVGHGPWNAPETEPVGDSPARPELLGAYRGYAWYTAETPPSLGLLLHDASDVLSVHAGGDYLGTVTPGGGSALLPAHGGGPLVVRAEIWGHSNFDDARLPALRLGSLRGFRAATSVTAIHELGPWRIQGAGIGTGPSPVCAWGNWITARRPHESRYVIERPADEHADTWVLRVEGLRALVEVTVNGIGFGPVNPHAPYIDITSALRPGGPARIELTLHRRHGEDAGRVTLLEGRRVTGWSAAFAEEPGLWSAALRSLGALDAPGSVEAQTAGDGSGSSAVLTAGDGPGVAEFPVRLAPGELRWLHADVADLAGDTWTAVFAGANLKLTALFNGHLVGRLWLPGGTRPQLGGGAPDRLTLPACWFAGAGDRLVLLAEAVHPEEPGELHGITFGH